MAQTRATGKACRLAFSWIMALAGYEPTPAEEMQDVRQSDDDLLITDAQHKMLESKINEFCLNRNGVKTWMNRQLGVEHFQGLTRHQYAELLAQLPKMAEIKFKREAEKEQKAEREAIHGEVEHEEPRAENKKERTKNKAAILEEKAKELRSIRPYRSGKTGYRQASEAEILEEAARDLRAETA